MPKVVHERPERGSNVLPNTRVRQESPTEASPLPFESSRDVSSYEPLGLPPGRRLLSREWRANGVSIRGLPKHLDEEALSGATDSERPGTWFLIMLGPDVREARDRLHD